MQDGPTGHETSLQFLEDGVDYLMSGQPSTTA
jgi:hypothetical protein